MTLSDNIDLRFLAEQQAEILTQLNKVRNDIAEVKADTTLIAEKVAALGVSLAIIENELSGVKMRVERLERR